MRCAKGQSVPGWGVQARVCRHGCHFTLSKAGMLRESHSAADTEVELSGCLCSKQSNYVVPLALQAGKGGWVLGLEKGPDRAP